MLAKSLRALLAKSIDYAGMFPPCSLDLEAALWNHANYIRTRDAWMLATFVLPIGEFDSVSANLSKFDKKHQLRISALGTKTENAPAFLQELKTTAQKIRAFSAQHVDLVLVSQLEMPLPVQARHGASPSDWRTGLALDVDLGLLTEARSILNDLELNVFWEAPADVAERTIAWLAQSKEDMFGYKLRTGGVTADAFLASQQIAEALVAAARHHVPIKFTAGLHHPIRQFRDEVKTKMHGFLNVLGAGVLAAEHDWDEKQTATMLEDENAGSFSFNSDSFAWREWKIGMERIKALRKLVISFGSCSFDEPREDLKALKLL